MIYAKVELNQSVEMKVDIYPEELYTICPICGKEHQLDHDIISELDDWQCSISCGSDTCNKAMLKKNFDKKA